MPTLSAFRQPLFSISIGIILTQVLLSITADCIGAAHYFVKVFVWFTTVSSQPELSLPAK